MSRSLPPLNALRAFDAAGRHQSFSRAADELRVSHSAISRHVRGLEDRLGVKLFRDLPRGVELTLEGRSYLERVLPALDMIADATDDLIATPSGQVTVNSEPLFAERFIIPRLATFQAAYPEIEVRLEASARLADVERYEADIAIRFAHTGALDGPCELLSSSPLYPHATPEFMERHIREPKDLLNVPRYRDRTNNIWRQWFAAAKVEAHEVTEGGWRLKSPLAYEAGLNGLGVYLGSSECVSFDLEMGRLVRCFDIGVRDGAFFLVYGSRGPRRSAVKQFRAWLLDEARPYRQPLSAN
ncbi:LysR family transcriptional regulator, glycine cleavage system transcriptional activator [Shimia gijangensis]|uniref:LysR family transcriptional regulator, glycine cleavage system transcriptional activator n=1 Tax=Shimia gijangensis TaxID=1470563 RepID=A0A1M6KFU9_9RHOB|nr:LysR substrate-binding domain-containing protein [Shimia gijangensis]SHJ57798.1 LysR family transcriptional regulator, glycine cleavage system transcriptional activator [Shimia gijangensis]